MSGDAKNSEINSVAIYSRLTKNMSQIDWTRSASLMKEFWTLCIFVMTVSEIVIVEIIPYSNIGLTHCL